MSKESIKQSLIQITAEDQVFEAEPLSAHTTFKIGGPAEFFVCPKTSDELVSCVLFARENHIDYFILGSGSDLLISDAGYPGIVICTQDLMADMAVSGTRLIADAGASLKDICDLACWSGLTGLEFACGIPGTVGGACFMNAGAYGGQISDVLESVLVLNQAGDIESIAACDLDLGYRTSRINTEGLVLLQATFVLQPGKSADIQSAMDDLMERRREKQPLEWPSAGSTFKRPEGYFAGKLIQDAGLQGKRIGGAQVSEKHAGFVINAQDATAQDVRALIRHIQAEIKSQFDVDIEPEVRFVGVFEDDEQV